MLGPVQLFLSTVSDEFRSYRDALRRMLQRPNVTVHVQEDFIPTGTETLDMLDLYIKGCDAVIHLVGDMTGAAAKPASTAVIKSRYGDFADCIPSLRRTLETDEPPISYTQWEAYLAVYHRKRLVIAVAEPGATRDAKHRIDPAMQAAQQAHLARLRDLERYSGITFGNADQLCNGIWRSSIHDLLVEAGIAKRLGPKQDAPIGAPKRPKPIALPYGSIGTLFKGRDEFMVELRRSLARATARPAMAVVSKAVHGLGGVGKTRLAVEYAWQHHEDYSAVLFVVADTPENLRCHLAALTGPMVLDLPEQKNEKETERVEAALRWLCANPNWFLIIDNVDSEEAATEVENLVAKLKGGQVLITTRLTKWSPLVEKLELRVLSDGAAAAFLLDRTEKGRRKAEHDPAQASKLARQVGHLALMLEQASAYINHHRQTFAQYLVDWNANREEVTAWFDPRVTKYPASVAVTWQTSVDQLGPAGRTLLEKLAWLGQEAIPELLLDVVIAGETETRADQRAALAQLETYSLVTRAPDAPTFIVHQLVQDVTRRKLTGEAACLTLMSAHRWIDAAFRGEPNDLRVKSTLDLLAPHVREVCDHAEAANLAGPTWRLLIRLGDVLRSRVPPDQVHPLYQRALAMLERLVQADDSNPVRRRELSVSYDRAADMLVAQGKFKEGLRAYRDSLAIRQRLAATDPSHTGFQRDLGLSFNKVGDVLRAQGELDQALEAHDDSLVISERLAASDPRDRLWQRDLAVSFNKVGDVLRAQGKLHQALKAYHNSFAIMAVVADTDRSNAEWRRDLAASHSKFAMIYERLGDTEQALIEWHKGRAIIAELVAFAPDHAQWKNDLGLFDEQIARMPT